MKAASPHVDSNESDVQEMNPESTPPMGSIEDINPIRQQESETKPSASSYVSQSSFHQKLPCGDLVGNREQYIRICAPLYNAASIGDWEAAQVIFGKHKDLILVEYAITENYETALHIAASAKNSKSVDKFVQNLVTMMTEKQLELTNKNDNTALCLAAAAGNVKIVRTLLEKNPALVDIPGSNGMMPLYMASLFGRSKMVNYLYDKSGQMSGNRWKDQNRSWVLQKCVEADHFDVAIKIVTYWPQLATSGIVLRVLARKTDAFKGTKPHFIRRILYPILALIHVKIGSSDQKPTDAMKLLRIMWAEIMKLPDREISSIMRGPADYPSTSGKDKEDVQQLIAKLPDRLYKLLREEESYQKGKKLPRGLDNKELKDQPMKFSSRILFVAAEMGNTEFLIELIRQYPDLIWKMNDNRQTIFHVAVIHRHEGIYNLLHEIGSMKDMITPMKDDEGNTMLHLVGKCPKNNHNQNDSGVGLQMQRELLKEMNQSITLGLGKPSYVTKRLSPLLGNGILRSNGHFWVHQRKIIAPEFFMDKVKGMVGLMSESAEPLLRKWEAACIEGEGSGIADIRVDDDLRAVSADVISRACFGSSYTKGKEIFSKLRTLQKTISSKGMLFGLPTYGLRKDVKSLEKEIDSLIWEAVCERKCQQTPLLKKDLLQMILEEAMDHFASKDESKHFIVDNCKNIYFAGHESTSVAASWCLMLLALHPEWQTHISDEMSEACPNGVLDVDSLPKLKSVTMVIQEAMRLFPPAAFVSREALERTQIGHVDVPKGVCIWSLIPTLHRDPEIWGPDSHVFRPERFINGVTKACKSPQAYVPFGVGARSCLGRNFAMAQLKVVISLITSKFKFSLSPNYQHSPAYRMVVQPGHGVNIIVQKS